MGRAFTAGFLLGVVGGGIVGVVKVRAGDASFSPWFAVLWGGGVASGLAGLWTFGHLSPLSEAQAADLVEQHNLQIRRDLGLAPAAALRPLAGRPRVQDVQLAPFAIAGGGGLVLGGRF